MEAGPVVKKADMKIENWINAYEKNNVEIGLRCGFKGVAQIGKGMWAMPDLMKDMLGQKVEHPASGASCAWVPSPTAATIHAIHYHQIFVEEVQADLLKKKSKSSFDDLINLPIVKNNNWSKLEILQELENNVQGILGYVVKWIDQGIGCSKVLDTNGIYLMEDRATCRISSQHIANWMHHGLINSQELLAAFKKMALVVDKQNDGDPDYVALGPKFNGLAFKAAYELALNGKDQPNGYTEPILHTFRSSRKKEIGN
jgi:malate synthase